MHSVVNMQQSDGQGTLVSKDIASSSDDDDETLMHFAQRVWNNPQVIQ